MQNVKRKNLSGEGNDRQHWTTSGWKLTNRMWFKAVCTPIDNDTRRHSGQNVVDSWCVEWLHNILNTVMIRIVVDKSTVNVKHLRFVFFYHNIDINYYSSPLYFPDSHWFKLITWRDSVHASIKASDTLEHQPTVWPVPYACAQPYHPGNGSHGQLFRPC